MTRITSSSKPWRSRHNSSAGRQVPVGLLGLAKNKSRVLSLTWPNNASTSAVRFFSGAITGLAPAALAAIGYIRNPCSLYSTSSPGPA